MEPDKGTTNVRNTTSQHWKRWLGPESCCLVPLTSFSEPDQVGGSLQPVWFALSEERPLAFFAGIWKSRHWPPPECGRSASSLDTKAMNYACSLVRNRLSGAAQLIVLTHNQHCMNEFKKHWKGWARGEPDKVKARLKFIDVTVPASTMLRTANIIDLPAHLREYESEYHYLFEKVLRFEEAAEGHFDYAFMMPNVLRLPRIQSAAERQHQR